MPEPKLFDTSEYLREDLIEFYRADGSLDCQPCGKKYRDHAFDQEILDFDSEPYLIRLCNGDLVKL